MFAPRLAMTNKVVARFGHTITPQFQVETTMRGFETNISVYCKSLRYKSSTPSSGSATCDNKNVKWHGWLWRCNQHV